MNCTCSDYPKNMEQLLAVIYNSHVHGFPYRMPAFKFCPWCGGELTEQPKMSVSAKDIDTINKLTKGEGFNITN